LVLATARAAVAGPRRDAVVRRSTVGSRPRFRPRPRDDQLESSRRSTSLAANGFSRGLLILVGLTSARAVAITNPSELRV
jgi:hypothetical protein